MPDQVVSKSAKLFIDSLFKKHFQKHPAIETCNDHLQ